MRRLILALLVPVFLLSLSFADHIDANASTGWARYDSDTYVRWHSHISRPTDESVTSWLRYNEARYKAVQRARHAHTTWLAQRRAIEAQRVSQAQQQPSSPGGGGLHALVCSFGWSCATASCIVSRESGWNPRARNPSSGAAGLFQLMPFHWLGKFDPYNPVANARYAYSLYRSSGWGPWGGACG